MKLSGFHVSVHSNGRELKEYSVEISPDGKNGHLLDTQSAREGEIGLDGASDPRLRRLEGVQGDERSSAFRGKAKSVHVYIDGHKMKQGASLPNHTRGVISGVYVEEKARRPFIFTEILKTGLGCPLVLNNSA
jgi:hypothetical protein